MLGVRHYHSVQVDLWCGPYSDFIADRVIDFDRSWDQVRAAVHVRHLAIQWPTQLDVKKEFLAFKQLLDVLNQDSSALERVTFLTTELEHYKTLQSALFEVFPTPTS